MSRLALLDCIPISEHLARADARFATLWWHWFFFAQPEIPERVINADPDAWYRGDPDGMGAENYAEFREATRDPEVVRAMLEDYRAGLDHRPPRTRRPTARRRTAVSCPLLVLWSLRDDLEELLRRPAGDLGATGPSTYAGTASTPDTTWPKRPRRPWRRRWATSSP